MTRNVGDFSFAGDKALVKALEALDDKGRAAVAAALYIEGHGVDADMVPRIPVDTGRLRSTHYVAPPTIEGSLITVEVGVGTDYAVAVHERTEVGHKVGEAKFLEKALVARLPGMGQRIGQLIWRAIETKSGVTPLPSTNSPARPKDTRGRDSNGRFLPRSKRG